MKISAIAISIFANIILEAGLFEKIKNLVLIQDTKILSGSEKRNVVRKELESIGITAANSLINLGIELAVVWVKSKAK
jgi:hypothetical protein